MLFLVFLIGFFLLCRITVHNSILERIGFALPVGLAFVTMFMTIMDWADIALTRNSLTILTIALLVVAVAVNYNQPKALLKQFVPKELDFTWFNLLWVGMLGVVVYLEYINFNKCMVYPTYDRDSLAAFDTIGYICAQEHTFHAMSIFDPIYFPRMHEAGSSISYLPMVQLSYAYVYTFGAATSKAVPAFIYLGFLFGFYGLCRKGMSHTGSMLVLLGIVLAPEMLSFASHSVTNVMQACMASAGLIYACLWINNRQQHNLWLAILLLAINNWMRAEGIVFIGTAWLLIIISVFSRKGEEVSTRKDWVNAVLPALSLLPLVLWELYSKACGLTSDNAIITHLFWDSDKAKIIFKGAWDLFSGGTYYGLTFHIFAIVAIIMILNGASIEVLSYKTKHHENALFKVSFLKYTDTPISKTVFKALLISVIAYYFILYQVDYKWDSIDNVLAYSAKRFNFCYVPIAWYFIACSALINKPLTWLESKIGLGGKFNFAHNK